MKTGGEQCRLATRARATTAQAVMDSWKTPLNDGAAISGNIEVRPTSGKVGDHAGVGKINSTSAMSVRQPAHVS
jgi:hypothetical protein